MEYENKNESILNLLLPIGLQSFFAIAALLLCVAGGLIYKNVQVKNDVNFEASTVAGYLNTKLQQTATATNVEIRTEEGIQVLILKETYGDADYELRIFCDGTFLKEDFVIEGTPFTLTGGNELLPVEKIEFALSDTNVLYVYATLRGEEEVQVALYLPEGGVK